MSTVKLGDVAVESRETIQSDMSGLPIVGLEHITPEEVILSNWAEDFENTFTRKFKKGDVLFGRRRAYLKKAAVAPFDGICSGDITVIRAKDDKIYPGLLPFVIQNRDFFEYAVGKSAGSLSPRVKWEHLKKYEFNLPPLPQQHKLAELLWSINEACVAYKRLLLETDELVKSQFIEMFAGGQYPDATAEEVCDTIVDCPHATPKYDGENLVCPSIRTSEIVNGEIEWKSMKYVSVEECTKRNKRLTPEPGDIVYAREGSYGDCVILPKGYKFCLGQRTMLFRPNYSKCTSEYLHQALRSDGVKQQADAKNAGVTVPHVNVADAKNFLFPLPPLENQKQFGQFVKQSDKSKFELNQTIAHLNSMANAIVRDKILI